MRIFILDECLRQGRKMQLSELKKACKDNEIIERKVYFEEHELISDKSIREDLKFMRDTFGAPIPHRNVGGYQYTDPNYSILNSPILQSELEVMHQVSGFLEQFKGLGLSDELNLIIDRASYLSEVPDQPERTIDFSLKPFPLGQHWLRPLFEAITQRKKVSIDYRPYQAEEAMNSEFQPYLLKQYNRRWYVVGKADFRDGITNYALDRIENVVALEGSYRIPKDFHEGHFDSIVGVTLSDDQPIENVQLKLRKPFSFYVLSKPMHQSQELTEETEAFHVFSYRLRFNKELISILMSYGQNVLEVSPKTLKDLLVREISEMHSNLS